VRTEKIGFDINIITVEICARVALGYACKGWTENLAYLSLSVNVFVEFIVFKCIFVCVSQRGSSAEIPCNRNTM